MRRWLAALFAIAAVGLFGLSCNSIVGIDDIEGTECSVASDCQFFGDCIKTLCNDGFCQHKLADARKPCGVGFCDGKGECVECIDVDDCEDPFFPLCAGDGRCVECLLEDDCKKNVTRPICSNNVCVQCVTEAECELLPEPCLESRCADGGCLIVTKGEGEMCGMDGTGTCDGKGTCDPALPK